MSFFGDLLGFERFQLGDWWNKAKDNPEQLLLGAGDPLSAKMWSGLLGKDYEPFVDQMGGPYGGSTISAFGKNDGGVYGRAREAGINTGPAELGHDAAHVVASIYAGGYGADKLGGLLGGSGGATGGDLSNVAARAAQSNPNVTAGNVAKGGGFNWMDLLQNANQMQGLLGGGQQEQQPQPVVMQQQPNDNSALRAQLAMQQRAQALRRKINRTAEENRELRELTRGLLG